MPERITPKLQLLIDSPYRKDADRMMDAGQSAAQIQRFLAENDFSISQSLVRKYMELRRQGRIPKQKSTTNADAVIVQEEDPANQRLLMELEALDMLIEKGFEAIKIMEPEMISPKMMMDAIRLKNELTGGNHAFLTQYGYASIKKVEDQKWQLVMQYLMSFVDDEKKSELLEGIEQIEQSVYAGTPWESEYLRAKNRAAAKRLEEEKLRATRLVVEDPENSQ